EDQAVERAVGPDTKGAVAAENEGRLTAVRAGKQDLPQHLSTRAQPVEKELYRVAEEPSHVDAAPRAKRNVVRRGEERQRHHARRGFGMSGRPDEQPLVDAVVQPDGAVTADEERLRPELVLLVVLEADA